MKNVLKKISAIALAFTLLGTGTAVTKKVNPNSITTLGAHAECQYHYTQHPENIRIEYQSSIKGNKKYVYEIKKCACCGQVISQRCLTNYR